MHLLIVEPLVGDARLTAYNNEQLKDLYYKNLQGQLWVFVEAIFLINNCFNYKMRS